MSFLLNTNVHRTSADVAVIDERSLTAVADRASGPNQFGAPSTVWADLRRYLRYGGVAEVITPPLPIRVAEAAPVRAALAADSLRVVAEVLAVAHGAAPLRPEPSLLALALAAASPDDVTRQAALLAFRRLARTGRDLFLFATYVQGQRGWGRGLRRAVGAWYNDRRVADLVGVVLHDPSWAGWRHADLLRLGHPKAASAAHDALYCWLLTGTAPDVVCSAEDDAALARLRAVSTLRTGVAPDEAARLIAAHRLPLASVPQWVRAEAAVWPGLIGSLDLIGLAEQLGTMQAAGALVSGSALADTVMERFAGDDRADPVRIMVALRGYGQGTDQHARWEPIPAVIAALEDAMASGAVTARPSDCLVRITVVAEAIADGVEDGRADLAALVALSFAASGRAVPVTVIGDREIEVEIITGQRYGAVLAHLRRAAAAAGPAGRDAPFWLTISGDTGCERPVPVGFASGERVASAPVANIIVRGTGEGVLRLLPELLRP